MGLPEDGAVRELREMRDSSVRAGVPRHITNRSSSSWKALAAEPGVPNTACFGARKQLP